MNALGAATGATSAAAAGATSGGEPRRFGSDGDRGRGVLADRGKVGNNPLCHHRVLEMQREGLRERPVRVEEAPGVPFDNGRFEIIVEEFGS
jgi:hypothetical protein